MGETLRILLAEASLELVPRELWGHPEIRRTAERYGINPGEVVLDKSLHYNAMSRLPYKWKRGRPDILHVTLLNVLDSPIAEDGRLELLVHTIDGFVYAVDPRTRIPKHYDRFKGLMAQLLRTGRVPPSGRPLIWRINRPLGSLVGDAVLLDEAGRRCTPRTLVEEAISGRRWIIIGVFPRGGFSQEIRRLASYRAAFFHGRTVKAWTVAARVLCAAEELMGYL